MRRSVCLISTSAPVADSSSTWVTLICGPLVHSRPLICWGSAHGNTRASTNTWTCTSRNHTDLFMERGQPISGSEVSAFPFKSKGICGFTQRQPNLDVSDKAGPLPPSPPWSLLHTHSDICMLFEEAAVLIQKLKLWKKKRGLWRLVTEGTEAVGNRDVYGWERSPRRSHVENALILPRSSLPRMLSHIFICDILSSFSALSSVNLFINYY